MADPNAYAFGSLPFVASARTRTAEPGVPFGPGEPCPAALMSVSELVTVRTSPGGCIKVTTKHLILSNEVFCSES